MSEIKMKWTKEKVLQAKKDIEIYMSQGMGVKEARKKAGVTPSYWGDLCRRYGIPFGKEMKKETSQSKTPARKTTPPKLLDIPSQPRPTMAPTAHVAVVVCAPSQVTSVLESLWR